MDGQTGHLNSIEGLGLRQRSLCSSGELEFGLSKDQGETRLVVLGPQTADWLQRFEGERISHGDRTLLVASTCPSNVAALRTEFSWLKPRTLGLGASVGFGDRLGVATSGHVHAMRAVGGNLSPIFAQQSIREMDRTGRNAQQVMDDATWGVFAEGWREGFGADADHLKTPEDIDLCVKVGYTLFTFDPGGHVDDAAEDARSDELRSKVEQLPWEQLEDSLGGLKSRYLREFDLEGHKVLFDEDTLYKAAAKYGSAIAHASAMYRHLSETAGNANFEVEISVDETETPTSPAQHIYIAGELQRLGVKWVSLAPRYVGRFEKGVDYIGDTEGFEADLSVHAAIARRYGPYKLSLHSGSDKFSIYEAMVRQTEGLVHLKTAGTSYLEALRTVAGIEPGFFREIYSLALECYQQERASYHVSASADKSPSPEEVPDEELPALLEQFDAREILHVTFGSVLNARAEGDGWRFYDHLMELITANQDAYTERLEAHFVRHLKPFSVNSNVSR